jgi:hypothetical protein
MKNYLLCLFFIFTILPSANAFWKVEEIWDTNYNPKLSFVCDRNEQLCGQLCNNKITCQVNEVVCRDCIGTSILMTNIFDGMGSQYRSTGFEVSSYEFVDFIKKGMYVTFSSKSIYNQTDSYDSDSLKNKFLSLCPSGSVNSLVFFSVKDGSNILDEVKYVVCDKKIFGMTNSPDIFVEDGGIKLKLDYNLDFSPNK